MLPVKAPGFHVYDVAPRAVNVPEDPLQMAVGVAASVNTGGAFTVTVTTADPVQLARVPVTV